MQVRLRGCAYSLLVTLPGGGAELSGIDAGAVNGREGPHRSELGSVMRVLLEPWSCCAKVLRLRDPTAGNVVAIPSRVRVPHPVWHWVRDNTYSR